MDEPHEMVPLHRKEFQTIAFYKPKHVEVKTYLETAVNNIRDSNFDIVLTF